MMPGWYGIAELPRALTEQQSSLFEAWNRAARRSGEEARELGETANGAPEPALVAGFGDFLRAQWFLWAGAGLSASEQAGRDAPGFGAGMLPLRVLALGTVASELYTGYAALRGRERWFPGLVREVDWELQHRRGARRVLDMAESLEGALIKAVQFASTRPDLLPNIYPQTLSSLQDRVPPKPWPVIRAQISRELGRPPEEVFAEVDENPIAAASIAQVHRARLHDGREVAVKVQYPGVEGLIQADLDALETTFEGLARIEPQIRLKPIADYLRWTLPLELDFGREAAAIEKLAEALDDREDIVVPAVVEGLTTGRLLVMDFLEGVKITDREKMLAAGIDPREAAGLLNDAYADQLFERGVLHADPHPGNIFVQPGPRLVLLDHGLTLELEPSFIAILARMVRAMREGDLDTLAVTLREAGVEVDSDAGLETLLGVVGVLLGARESFGGDTLDLVDFSRDLGASVGGIPPRLLLAGRAIGLLDGITRQLDPDLDALEIVVRYA